MSAPIEGRWYWIKYDNGDPGEQWYVARRVAGNRWHDDISSFNPANVHAWVLIPDPSVLMMLEQGGGSGNSETLKSAADC